MGISIDYNVINIIDNPDLEQTQYQDQNPHHQDTISYDQFIRFLCIMSAIYPTQLN